MQTTDDLQLRADPIECLVLDVDGVLTDGCLAWTTQQQESKQFHVQDGLGIQLAQLVGLRIVIMTGRRSIIVDKRMQELEITDYYSGIQNKLVCLQELKQAWQLPTTAVLFMGDDLPDLACRCEVSLFIAPANATASVRRTADGVTERPGGQGAVREMIDWLLQAKAQLSLAEQRYLAQHSS